MLITNTLNQPGEHAFLFPGQAGPLEAVLSVPPDANPRFLAVLGHPHSLQGGTMQNKVVTTLTRAFQALGIASLRFNFRGVGQSGGEYAAGIGESEDMLLLASQWLSERPDTRVLFAGFSFGSYVAYRAAAQHPHAMLITVAPPVHHFDYEEFASQPTPWVVVQGDLDDVVPIALVEDFMARQPALSMIEFPDTGHFFHGKLIPLKEQLIDAIRTQVSL
jgi:alpha/beta superfamily hydrolase